MKLGEQKIGKSLRDLLEVIQFTEKVSAKIHGVLDEAEIYRTVSEEFSNSKNYNSSILLLTEDGDKLEFTETSISSDKIKAVEKVLGLSTLKHFTVDLDKSSYFSRAVRGGETFEVGVDSLLSELFPRPLANLVTRLLGYQKRSGILTPLKRHGEIIGVLVVDSVSLGEYLIPPVRSLAEQISTALELSDRHVEQGKAEERVRYLNEVLRAIRNVNQLIVREKDRERLLDGICKHFVETKGYYSAWVALIDDEGRPVATASAGLREGFNLAAGGQGELLGWAREALRRRDVHMIADPTSNYLLRTFEEGPQESALVTRLEHGGRTYGILVASVPREMVGEEEKALFEEVAGDIAYALHNLEVEEARKRMERELRESEEKFRSIAETSVDVIFTITSDGDLTYVSPAAEDLTGYGVEELMGSSFLKLLPESEVPRTVQAIGEAVKEEIIRGFQLQIKRRDGARIPVEVNVSKIVREGEVTGFHGILRDITERKRMEEELRNSEERFRSLVELAPDGILTMDVKGVITSINTAFSRMTGLSKEDAVGSHFSKLGTLRARDIPKYLRLFGSIIRGKAPPVIEFEFSRSDGTMGWGEARANIIEVGDGRREILVVARDITEHKRMMEQLQSYSKHLEELVEERTRKLRDAQEQIISNERLTAIGETAAMVGHDLRNPLQVLLNTIYLIKDMMGEGLREPTTRRTCRV